MSLLLHLAVVALGGAVGGLGRFLIAGLVARRFGDRFPWATLAVNVSGAAAIGVLAGLLLARDTHAVASAPLWAGLVIGVLGSYTTVSSFSLDTLFLLRDGAAGRALANIMASLVLCLVAAGAGWTLVLWLGGG